jgi:hypothetical protein
MPDADDIIRRFERLVHLRGDWESHWTEIAERVLPRYSDTFQRPSGGINRGDKRTDKMFDATAAIGVERFAAAMESMLTPRNSTWQRLRPSDRSLARNRRVKLWFEDANRVLFSERYRPQANFASQNHEVFIGLGAFGTSCMHVDRHPQGGLRYRAIDLRELFFETSFNGVIDTVYRVYTYTVRQLQQQADRGFFENLPDDILNHKDHTATFEVIHAVMPRGERLAGSIVAKDMPFASYYVLKRDKLIIRESGFNEFPYAVSRHLTGPGEVYGRSPAMMALPAIKVLNEQKKTMLKQGHRVVDPVLLTHDDGVLDTFSLKPGAMNVGGVNAQGQRLVHELPTGNLAAGQELMDMERAVINDAFMVTLFQILVDNPRMTATEVLERSREKGALIAPTMGRQQTEYLGTMTPREMDLLQTQKLLPEMPPELIEAQGEYEIEYDSPLTRSQRAEEASGWLRTLEAAIAYANTTQDLSVLDNFNADAIYTEMAEINAMPLHWLNDPQTVEMLRQQRAQQAQMRQMVEAAPAAAGVMKAMTP